LEGGKGHFYAFQAAVLDNNLVLQIKRRKLAVTVNSQLVPNHLGRQGKQPQ